MDEQAVFRYTENLETLLEEPEKSGVAVVGAVKRHNHGNFIRILEVEGNEIEP